MFGHDAEQFGLWVEKGQRFAYVVEDSLFFKLTASIAGTKNRRNMNPLEVRGSW